MASIVDNELRTFHRWSRLIRVCVRFIEHLGLGDGGMTEVEVGRYRPDAA
jgi:hypothetical protein